MPSKSTCGASTIQGYAAHEKAVLTQVTEARASVAGIKATPELINDEAAFAKFQKAQAEMSSALARLLVVSENYPQLTGLESASVRSQTTLAYLNLGQQAIIALGVTAMMWRAASGVAEGRMTIGDLVLVNAFLIQLYMPLNFLGIVYREIRQALTDIERMFALLDENKVVAFVDGAASGDQVDCLQIQSGLLQWIGSACADAKPRVADAATLVDADLRRDSFFQAVHVADDADHLAAGIECIECGKGGFQRIAIHLARF